MYVRNLFHKLETENGFFFMINFFFLQDNSFMWKEIHSVTLKKKKIKDARRRSCLIAIKIDEHEEQTFKNKRLIFLKYWMIYFRIWSLQRGEAARCWSWNKLLSGMAGTDKVIGWCPTEFRITILPIVGLNLQCYRMVTITFS